MRRCSAPALAIAVALAALACARKPPKPGDVCKIEDEGTMVCAGPTTALLCRGSRLVERACRGPGGCKGADHATCDMSLGREGDACTPPDLYAPIVCAEDEGAILVCKDGKLALDMRCRGPKGCNPKDMDSARKFACDRTIGEVGDACNVRGWQADGLGACSVDKKASLVCDKDEKGKLIVKQVCGGTGCEIRGLGGDPTIPVPVCDRGNFAPGAPCGRDDGDECADASTLLVCNHATAKYESKPCGPKEQCKHDPGFTAWCRPK
jgi:hypothetical protein